MEPQRPRPSLHSRLRNSHTAPSAGAERRKVLGVSIVIMTTVALAVGSLTTVRLYRTALEQQQDRLVEIAQSWARLIEAVARFDAQYSTDDIPGGAWAATLEQIEDAHSRFVGFGETGEFTLARREGDQIVFLLSHRDGLESPAPVPFHSELAEPVRRALSGESGVVVGLDYRGEVVLAAHEPLGLLDLGIVAKIDMAEIRAPFVKTGRIAAGGAMVIIVLGGSLILLGVDPIIRRSEANTARLAVSYERVKQEVNERKQAQHELQKLTGTLEQRVFERTRELEMSRTAAFNIMEDTEEARRHLAQTAAELARPNAELEQFAYVASHDLQEPLRMISSFTQLLAERYGDKLDADAHDFIQFAVGGARRMQELIDALLTYSRVGATGSKMQPTDTSVIVDESVAVLRSAIEESGAVIHRDTTPLPTVLANKSQLARVFQNLLSNAIKFHGPEPPTIHVGAERHNGAWQFHVADKGPGIEHQYAERIDSMGEMANIIGGGVKGLFEGECRLSLPTVADGTVYTLRVRGSKVVSEVGFECEGYPFKVSLLEREDLD